MMNAKERGRAPDQAPSTICYEESLLRFQYRDDQLYWELRCRTDEDGGPASYALGMRIPVEGFGNVQQTFHLDAEAVMRLVLWLGKCQGIAVEL